MDEDPPEAMAAKDHVFACHEFIAYRIEQGDTYRGLGARVGLSGERIRQLLHKRMRLRRRFLASIVRCNYYLSALAERD